MSAVISPCGLYRYELRRVVPTATLSVRVVTFVMLNPSTADAEQDDPTIRRCLGFAQSWSCTELRVVNLFALRATDPKALFSAADPVGPENNDYLLRNTRASALTVVAWGAHRMASKRGREVCGLIDSLRGIGLRCLGTTKGGAPRHPLYVPSAQKHERFSWYETGGAS